MTMLIIPTTTFAFSGTSYEIGGTTFYNFNDGTTGSSYDIGDTTFYNIDGRSGTSSNIGGTTFFNFQDNFIPQENPSNFIIPSRPASLNLPSDAEMQDEFNQLKQLEDSIDRSVDELNFETEINSNDEPYVGFPKAPEYTPEDDGKSYKPLYSNDDTKWLDELIEENNQPIQKERPQTFWQTVSSFFTGIFNKLFS